LGWSRRGRRSELKRIDAASIGDNLEVLQSAALSRAVRWKTHVTRMGELSLDPKCRAHGPPGTGKTPQPVLCMRVRIRRNKVSFSVNESPARTRVSNRGRRLAAESRHDDSHGRENPQEPTARGTARCAEVEAVMHVSPPPCGPGAVRGGHHGSARPAHTTAPPRSWRSRFVCGPSPCPPCSAPREDEETKGPRPALRSESQARSTTKRLTLLR
jgi:hypothetical protein